jgi:uncharacterized protein HemY
MSKLLRVAIFILVAVAVGVFARLNSGYVQIATPVIQVETSLNLIILLWVASLIVLYLWLRTVWGMKRLLKKKD